MEALERFEVPLYLRKVISSYLSDRTLIYNTGNGTRSYNITGGVPQGWVLGPLLWIVVYDDLLRLQLPKAVTIVAFADNVALVVTGKSMEEVQYLADRAIELVAGWLNDHRLALAAEKTQAVIIARTKARRYATFIVDGKVIHSTDAIKYLGVTLDARLKFKEHLQNAGTKASKVTRALAGIMPNMGGPREPRRYLLALVVISVTLYAAVIWAEALAANKRYGTTCR